MKEFKGKVAVVTGAASGIGKGFAERCLKEGMNVVLADVEERALMHTAEEMAAAGGTVIPVVTDVSSKEAIEALAQKTMETYGGVHILFNNAGVASFATTWESTLADWEWVLGVNLWGVIYGVRTFVPLMLAQQEPCHIINTASIAGLTAGPMLAPYHVSKHGVVALSESLYQELRQGGTQINVSVLCPYWVNTKIHESARNRPTGLANESGAARLGGDGEMQAAIAAAIESGMSTDDVADQIFKAIVDEQLYILTHPETKPWVEERMNNIISGRNPTVDLG